MVEPGKEREAIAKFAASEEETWENVAHRNPTVPAPNMGVNMIPPYSAFLNILEQAISCLKAAIKADISRLEIQRRLYDRDEARVRGIPIGEFRSQYHRAISLTPLDPSWQRRRCGVTNWRWRGLKENYG